MFYFIEFCSFIKPTRMFIRFNSSYVAVFPWIPVWSSFISVIFLSLSCNYAHQFIPRYWPLFHFFSKSHPLMKVSQIHRWFTFYNPPNKSTYHDDYDRCFRIQTFKLYAHPSAKLSNTHGVVLKRMTAPLWAPMQVLCVTPNHKYWSGQFWEMDR